MEEKKISSLKRELKQKEFQFNSIFEFSESIYSSFQIDSIIRVYFSTLMGQLGISRVFLCDEENSVFRRRGFAIHETEINDFRQAIKKLDNQWFSLTISELDPQYHELISFMEQKKIFYLVNISESQGEMTIMGMGLPLNSKMLTNENIEYAYFVSKFSMNAIKNAILINKLIETKRMEHELKIARDIQLSLLPQSIPELENLEISVVYEPIHEVGGDYYDIMKKRKKELPILIADVEGKGLSAALLAASSQAILRSLNELYLFEPGKFISKANTMICEFTHGKRFITLFWMLANDETLLLTYVNAGHVEPLHVRNGEITFLDKGGFLTGFIDCAEYEKGEIQLLPGDIIVAFTDGVTEVENKEGEQFGIERLSQFFKSHSHLGANDLTATLFKIIKDFSQDIQFRDDFTLLVLKAR